MIWSSFLKKQKVNINYSMSREVGVLLLGDAKVGKTMFAQVASEGRPPEAHPCERRGGARITSMITVWACKGLHQTVSAGK